MKRGLFGAVTEAGVGGLGDGVKMNGCERVGMRYAI